MAVSKGMGLLLLGTLGLGGWLLLRARKAQAVIIPPSEVAPPTIEPTIPGTVQILYSQEPTRTDLTQSIVSSVQTYPEATSVRVSSPTDNFNVDVNSTTKAAQISGMSYSDWLNLYAWGISPGVGQAVRQAVRQGLTLVGFGDGTGAWR